MLGIPHPPGNPLFVILAHTFGLLPLAASYAERINLFAAVTSAAAAGLWFLVAERWLQGIVRERWARYAAAFGGVLVGATSWSVWNQCTVNEKVYTVSLLSIALVMWLVVRWGDDEPGPHRDRWLVLIAYVLALTSTNHLMGAAGRPGRWWSTSLDRLARASPARTVLGRASCSRPSWASRSTTSGSRCAPAQYPPINEGEPIGLLQPGAQGRAQPGAVRQARRWATGRPASPGSSATSGSTTPGSSPATGAGSPAWPPRSSPCWA